MICEARRTRDWDPQTINGARLVGAPNPDYDLRLCSRVLSADREPVGGGGENLALRMGKGRDIGRGKEERKWRSTREGRGRLEKDGGRITGSRVGLPRGEGQIKVRSSTWTLAH